MRLSARYWSEKVTAEAHMGREGDKGDKGVLTLESSRRFLVRDCVVLLFIISRYILFLYFNMPKSLFDISVEKELLRLYVEVFAGSSGRTLTTAEKYAAIAERLSSQGVVLGWPTVTASNADNKIDSVCRKRKKVYKTLCMKICHHLSLASLTAKC